MPKDFSLPNMVKDLEYTVNGTFVHQWLFRVCPPRPGLPRLTMLEPGSGSGKFGLAYALQGAEVTLLDIDHEVVDYCTRILQALEVLLSHPVRANVWRRDIFELEMAPDMFDLVFNEGVPQHWTDEEKRQGCIDRMARWARPGGLVVIVGNNGHNRREQETDRSFQFTYEGMPPTRRCFTREELEERMARAGLKDVQVAPLGGTWELATLLGAYGRK